MSKLIESYTAIAQACGFTVKEDGSVFLKDDRYFVKGKPLTLPLTSVLNRSDAAEKLIMHPLAEAAAKGESDVLEELRNRFSLQLNAATGKLITFFLQLGIGETKLTLDPDQMRVMDVVKAVGEKEVRDIIDVIKATARGEGKRTPLVKIYLSRKPLTVGNVKYYRTGVVSFPLYHAAKQELKDKDKGFELLGVKINKKGLESLCRLVEFIYPGIDKDPEAYNQGSTSTIAPFADALFRSVGGLYATFNEKIDMYKNVADVEALRLPTSWVDVVEMLDELFPLIQLIPLQPNADGKARVAELQTADISTRPAAPAAAPTEAPGNMHGQSEVRITAAPVMHAHHQPAAHAPAAAPAHAEPEFIRGPNGTRRNPNFLRPAMAGVPTAGVLDPYSAGVMLPANTTQIPMQQVDMYGRPLVHQANYASPYQQPQHQQHYAGGRLPGLNY